MASYKRSYVPCNEFARETWEDSLGAPSMLVKNGFVQEYYEILEAVPRACTADLPLIFVEEEGDCCYESTDDASLTVAVVNEEREEPAPETAHEELAEEVHPQELENTTLMIRNLPMRATHQTLLKTWPPDGSYDFLYVPFSFEKHRNIGYAFINFVTHAAAIEFFNAWHDTVPDWTNAKNIARDKLGSGAGPRQELDAIHDPEDFPHQERELPACTLRGNHTRIIARRHLEDAAQLKSGTAGL